MAPPKTKRVRRVLLAATVGLATLTLEGCLSCGNLLPPPEPIGDAGQDAAVDSGVDAGPSAIDAGEPDAR